MKSTGEVMGSSPNFGEAYAKALLASGARLPLAGTAFISVNDNDKPGIVRIARELRKLGFRLIATEGTLAYLEDNAIEATLVLKVHEGRPNVVDRMINHEVNLVINTPLGRSAFHDDTYIRRAALQNGIACITTLSAAAACVEGIRSGRDRISTIATIQDQHAVIAT